jgi:hypothetical protein
MLFAFFVLLNEHGNGWADGEAPCPAANVATAAAARIARENMIEVSADTRVVREGLKTAEVCRDDDTSVLRRWRRPRRRYAADTLQMVH